MHNNVILKLYTFLSNFSLFPLQIRKVCWLCADICGTTRSPWNASRYTHLFHRAVTEQGRHISSGFVLKCKYNLFLEINKSGNRFFLKEAAMSTAWHLKTWSETHTQDSSLVNISKDVYNSINGDSWETTLKIRKTYNINIYSCENDRAFYLARLHNLVSLLWILASQGWFAGCSLFMCFQMLGGFSTRPGYTRSSLPSTF